MFRITPAIACFVVLSSPALPQTASGEADPIQGAPLSEIEALEAWNVVYEVFSHPRCASCHVGADNRPRWSGEHYGLAEGEWRFHGMNINAGDSRIGAAAVTCSACHQERNSVITHGPPGAPHWALAPVEMGWWQASSAELCFQLKDPERTGGRTLEEVADHVGHDALVLWAWDPGPGREVPPHAAEATVNALLNWVAAGAPCPPGD